jgi:hypothetical protein
VADRRRALFDESKELGCVSISFIDSSLKTRWIYPQENEGSIGFDHGVGSQAARRDRAARAKNGPGGLHSHAESAGKKNRAS